MPHCTRSRYSLAEIRDILANLDFRNFMDDD